MGLDAERTAREWFEQAAFWYVQGHQGCAHCGERHCVFRQEWAGRLEYHCTACDFSACRDGQTGRYYVDAGEGQAVTATTRQDSAPVNHSRPSRAAPWRSQTASS